MPPTKMFHLIELVVKERPRSSECAQNHACGAHPGQSQGTGQEMKE